MTVKPPIARQTKPELEHDYVRSPAGYGGRPDGGLYPLPVARLSHPLARWHYHDEYMAAPHHRHVGKVFVGDWIGQFQPGQLVLTGPRLPQ